MIGYGTTSLPGFYSRDSGFDVDVRLDDPDQIARVMKENWSLGLQSGIVIANPIPELYALPREIIDGAINQALAQADTEGISGKAVTPYLISRITELTAGVSSSSSIQLGLNNAKLAASLAVAFSAISARRLPD
ncbi:Pseudouridine-5'-phosphate glycosidase [compost metagenome]